MELLPELLTPVRVGALPVVLLLLRPAAHPQLPAHLFDGQLLRGELLGVQAEGEVAAVPPQVPEGDGHEDALRAGAVVDLVKDLLVQPLHVLDALLHLLHVADHLLLHVVEERSGLGPQAADGPMQVQERSHGDGGRLEDAGTQHPEVC